ncbi:MAG: tetratricopeptide repeat protein [Acidobacteriota bacterium]|nr:tetratricopeptide repeat protein [Acidobacteriota bacterium]
MLLLLSDLTAAQSGGGDRPAPRSEPAGNSTPAGTIRGRVLMQDGSPVTQPIRITLVVIRGDQSTIYTDSQGMFEIGDLSPGTYTLVAEEDRERKLETRPEQVRVYSRTPTNVTLYLKEKGEAVKEGRDSHVVSAAELEQKVPSDAAREYERGTKAGRDGKTEEAVAHLRKAVSIYPEYLKARNDLATFLLAQGHLDQAAEELRKAVQIDPKAFNPRLNLGIVLVQQRDFAGAADNLEKALSLDASSPAAHLYAGLARLGLGDTDRAERELSTAYELGGAKFALAQFHLGQLYMNKGERALALKAFETYLHDAPDAGNAEQVRRLISILR